MSYRITLKMGQGIESVTMKSTNQVNQTVKNDITISGITESVTFTRKLKSGYEFWCWRCEGDFHGNVHGDEIVDWSEDSLEYPDDLLIGIPLSDVGDITLTPIVFDYGIEGALHTVNFEELNTMDKTNIYLRPNELFCGAVTFTHSGTAKFYTTGNSDTYGWLTETPQFDRYLGRYVDMSQRLTGKDDGGDGDNFKIEYTKIEAHQQYYIWVRASDRRDNVNCVLYIEPPTTPDITPTNLKGTRGDQSLTFTWDGVSGTTGFVVSLYNDNNTLVKSKTVTSNSAIFTGLNYGKTYTVTVSAFNDDETSGSVSASITTAPARPEIISATQTSGVISGSWSLVGESPISDVYVTLYNSNGNSVGDSYRLTFSNQTSGSFTFPQVADGTYVIQASSVLRLDNGGVIWSVRDGGDDGGSDNGEYKYISSDSITVSAANRPENWEWTTTITPTAIIPMDQYGLHPVTAVEWNNFCNRINEFRVYLGYSPYSFTTVSQYQALTSEIYNEAILAMRDIKRFSEVKKGDVINANRFTSLRDALNEIE